jgi:hypothetical protein
MPRASLPTRTAISEVVANDELNRDTSLNTSAAHPSDTSPPGPTRNQCRPALTIRGA